MDIDRISEQLKDLLAFLASVIFLTELLKNRDEIAPKDKSILAREEDNYLNLKEWG